VDAETAERERGDGMRKQIAAIVAALAAMGMVLYGADITVSWTFATTNVDGTPLTDLAGAKVYYGTSSSNYTVVVDVPGGVPGGNVSHKITGLKAGTTYFINGTAYNTSGLESDFCTQISKKATTRPGKHANLGVKP
jgi:hypothetical protein